jgi:hypothetical protein
MLRMYLALRALRSGCTAGVSFERRDGIAQDTVAVGGKGRRGREWRGSLARDVPSAGGGSGRGFNVRCVVWSVWGTLQSGGAVRSCAGSRARCSPAVDGRERRVLAV